MNNYLSCIFLILLTSSNSVTAKNGTIVKTNRYTFTDTRPKDEQIDLLSVVLTVNFPSSVQTIGQALDFVLPASGYHIDVSSANESQVNLLAFPLPEVHRRFDNVNLRDILKALAGEGYEFVSNAVTRTITYQISLHNQYSGPNPHNHSPTLLSKNNPASQKILTKSEWPLSNITAYGPIKASESLSNIALKMHHYRASEEQIMVAIFLKNPRSFNNNINALIEEKTLLLPRKGFVHSISEKQARHFIEHQHKKWLGLDHKGEV